MLCGIWGTLALGIFAAGKYGLPTPIGADNSEALILTGVLYGGGTTLLISQIIGSAAVTAATFAVGMVLMYAVKMTGQLRVSAEGEMEGLDRHEHGMPAYPEFVIAPHGPMTTPRAVDR